MVKSTVLTILKTKDAIKAANVAKEVTVLTKQRAQVREEGRKLLLVWLTGDSVSEAVICETARKLPGDLLQENLSTSTIGDECNASRGGLINSVRGKASSV